MVLALSAIPTLALQVYKEPYYRRYYASAASQAFAFNVIGWLGTIVLSFAVAFTTGNFWTKLSFDTEQPTVTYTGDAILLLQVLENDANYDGKPDTFTFSVVAPTPFPILSVKLFTQFRYTTKETAKIRMYTAAYMAYSSGTPMSYLMTDGELLLRQRQPLKDNAIREAYDIPLINSSSLSALTAVPVGSVAGFDALLASYLDRNETTHYTNFYPLAQPGLGNRLSMTVKIRIPVNEIIVSRPQVLEMLKFGWIQFLATWALFATLFEMLRYVLYKYQVLETRTVSDLKPSRPTF